ncbi:MAG: two component transcriptional regulator, LuxR family [Verrucomicrobia bacterium]|nr:two component transcriptional regulator, LuxR family [Verrucomicrobiota bacterium]
MVSSNPFGAAAKTPVLLVEDHVEIRKGMRVLIERHPEYTVCGEASHARQAEELLATCQPRIAVVDLSLTQGNGLELTKSLRALRPALSVLIVSVHHEEIYGKSALQAGASGYLMKSDMLENLLPALDRIRRGETYLSPRLEAYLRNIPA